MKRTNLLLILILGFLPLAACDSSTAPAAESDFPGILAWDAPPTFAVEQASDTGEEMELGEPPALVAPDTVDAGSAFDIKVTTILPNGCWTRGPVETEVSDHLATIEVFDRGPDDPWAICTLIYSWATREIGVQFDEEGEAIIRVVGRRIQGEDFQDVTKEIIEHVVVVR